ncbi:MAG: hypothetical protein IPM34_06730 [Saprospiraceae bacterium]|nr:hypothetical protein [Saprospiraceae bacterium]
MKPIWELYFSVLRYPQLVLQDLMNRPNKLVLGFKFLSIPIGFYTLMSLLLVTSGEIPDVFTSVLKMSTLKYFPLSILMFLTGLMLAWLAAYFALHQLASCLKPQAGFETGLLLLAFSISTAMYVALIHDLPVSLWVAMGNFNVMQDSITGGAVSVQAIVVWCFEGLYHLAFFVLFPLSVKCIYQLNTERCIGIGFISVVVFKVVYLACTSV